MTVKVPPPVRRRLCAVASAGVVIGVAVMTLQILYVVVFRFVEP